MAIEPFVRCGDMPASVAFYTQVLDFDLRIAPDPDPQAFLSRYALLARDGSLLHLSAHAGDGVFGSVIYVRVDDLDPLFALFVERGLNVDDPNRLPALTMAPVEQSWGMKEFSVRDPDGNRLTFGQSLDGGGAAIP